MRRKLLIWIVISIICPAAFATSQSIYLQANNYLDVKTGQLIKPANILIEDGMIKAINPKTIPANAVIIKKPELTLLPGMMDTHVHVTCDLDKEFPISTLQDDASISALRGAKNAKKILMAGFTTVRDLQQCYPGTSFPTVALAKASEKDWIGLPHIIAAGHGLSITGGHLDPDMFGSFAPNALNADYRAGVADGIDEVIKATRHQIKYGAKVIKVAATGGVLSTESGVGNQQYSYEELKAIVDEANRHGIPVAAHAHGTAGINAALKAGVKSIEHGSLLNDESITLLKAHNAFLVPTTYIIFSLKPENFPPNIQAKAKYLLPLAKQNITKAIQAKVRIAFGTDSGVFPHGENAKEFSAMIALGMTPIAAIQSATINSAELLGTPNRGQIKPGFDADIIGVSENPLTNIKTLEQVKFVMKDGKIY